MTNNREAMRFADEKRLESERELQKRIKELAEVFGPGEEHNLREAIKASDRYRAMEEATRELQADWKRKKDAITSYWNARGSVRDARIRCRQTKGEPTTIERISKRDVDKLTRIATWSNFYRIKPRLVRVSGGNVELGWHRTTDEGYVFRFHSSVVATAEKFRLYSAINTERIVPIFLKHIEEFEGANIFEIRYAKNTSSSSKPFFPSSMVLRDGFLFTQANDSSRSFVNCRVKRENIRKQVGRLKRRAAERKLEMIAD